MHVLVCGDMYMHVQVDMHVWRHVQVDMHVQKTCTGTDVHVIIRIGCTSGFSTANCSLYSLVNHSKISSVDISKSPSASPLSAPSLE